MDPDLRMAKVLIDSDKENADQKSSDMSKPGHSTPHPDVHHLQDKPETKNDGRWNGYDAYEEKKKNQGQDIGSGIEDKISSQNSGDGSAGSYHRDLWVGIENDVGKASSHSWEKVEKGKADRTKIVLDIIPENPQIEHVS